MYLCQPFKQNYQTCLLVGTMAPEGSILTTKSSPDLATPVDPSQTLRAATALLRKIQSDKATQHATAEKSDLLADTDADELEDDIPVWLVLTTKKHIVDKKRLKPGKIALPHPVIDTSSQSLRICLITVDPQRAYKDLIAEPSFSMDLAKRIGRVIGLKKLKAKYKSYESRRQLLGEYDVFLADDRIITHLPQILGKVFYKSGSKRPVPVSLEGRRQNFDDRGNKRQRLAEGGSKVVKSAVRPEDVAREIDRAVSSALVHLAPSTSTAVKVGKSSMQPQQLQDNVESVTQALVDKYVPQKWRNVKAVHLKGPNTAALPIWLAEELWEDEKDVLEEALPEKQSKKRRRSTLVEAADQNEESLEVLEVPGPDGKMRKIEKASVKRKDGNDVTVVKTTKKRKSELEDDVDAKATERAKKAARKEALQKQKAAVKGAVNGVKSSSEAKITQNGGARTVRKSRTKAADLL